MATKKPSTRKPKIKKVPIPKEVPQKTNKTIEPEDTVDNEADNQSTEASIPSRTGLAFVIPFVDSTVKWEELRYALRSIEKYGIPEDKVFLLASKLPDWVSDEVTLVKCEQIQGKRFAKSFDAVAKLKAAIAHPDIPEQFIYTYDDTVFLSRIDFAIPTIAVSKINLLKISNFDGSATWIEVLSNSIERLRANGLPTYNYETHLPRTLEKSKLAELFAKFGFQKRPYLVSTLYYNYFCSEPEYELFDGQLIKADIRTDLSPEQIAEIVKYKACLNYNDAGLNIHLKNYLSEKFDQKSRFEK
ncbi:MAG: hypothetical protein EOM59_13260 [Clostridia bacterium]|nr:hypothetical protein [Clostridia bacterium]